MKRFLSVLLVLTLLGGILVIPANAWDANNFKYEFDKNVIKEDERNDSIETAKKIKSGQTVRATFTVPESWKGASNGVTVMDDFCDMDYFEFTLTERSDILIAGLPITYSSEDYLMIVVSDGNDETIFKSFSNADEMPDKIIAMITDTLDAGTYYITFLCGVDNARYNGAEYMGYFEAYPIGDDPNAGTSEGSEEESSDTASKFNDATEITPDYRQAIGYMVDNGILSGGVDNNYRPKGVLSRGAATKIIGNLTLGAAVAEKLMVDTAPFTDVPVSHTFAGYIAFCTRSGICNGYSDNTFKPAAPLSTGAYAKMLLNWARYTGDSSRYVGEHWSAHVYMDAVAAGIIDENINLGDAVTREYAAYMAYQAVKYAKAHGKMPAVQQPAAQYPSAITLSSSSLNIKQNSGGSVTATITPSDAVNKNITWSSSNRAVATVDSSGYAWGIAPGTAVITAKTANGLTASYTVTVTGAEPTPTTSTVINGGSTAEQDIARAKDALKRLKSQLIFPDSIEVNNIYAFTTEGGADPYYGYIPSHQVIRISYSAMTRGGNRTWGYYYARYFTSTGAFDYGHSVDEYHNYANSREIDVNKVVG